MFESETGWRTVDCRSFRFQFQSICCVLEWLKPQLTGTTIRHRRRMLPLTDHDIGHYQGGEHRLNGPGYYLVEFFWLRAGREKEFQTAETQTVLYFQHVRRQERNRCIKSYMRRAVCLISSRLPADSPVYSSDIERFLKTPTSLFKVFHWSNFDYCALWQFESRTKEISNMNVIQVLSDFT